MPSTVQCGTEETNLGQNLLVLLPLVYIVPSLIAYVVVFGVILRHFRSSTFYVLFFANGISEVLLWFTGSLKYRAPSAPVFFPLYAMLPDRGFQITVVFFINYVVPLTARCTNFLLTFNRYTLVRFSSKTHAKVWEYLLPISIAVSCLLAMGINAPIFVVGAHMLRPTKENCYYSFQSEIGVEYRQSLYSMASVVTLGTATFALNISIARGLWKHHVEQRQVHARSSFSAQSNVRDAEMKICIMTFIMFLTSIVAFVVQSIFFTYGFFNMPMSMPMIQTLSRTQNFSEDLHIFSQPWLLIVMSRAIRDKVLRIVPFVAPPPSTAVTAVAFSSSPRRSVISDRRISITVTHH